MRKITTASARTRDALRIDSGGRAKGKAVYTGPERIYNERDPFPESAAAIGILAAQIAVERGCSFDDALEAAEHQYAKDNPEASETSTD